MNDTRDNGDDSDWLGNDKNINKEFLDIGEREREKERECDREREGERV